MRRRLILVTVAVTSMVVIAFLVPLFMLVSDLARNSALSDAERDAESLARVLSVLVVEEDLASAIATVGEDRIEAVGGSVILPSGVVVGAPIPEHEDLSSAVGGTSFIAEVDGGVAVYVPVLTTGGDTAVVRVFTSDELLHEGVVRSWFVLTVLGLALIAIAAWVADRLGRSMVQPVNSLAETAQALGHGDLTARVEPSGPEEIREVGIELNRLATQIGRLLQAERETAADLAHRLRTPLTAARLTIDGLETSPQKDRLVSDLDELERTTDFIIREARRPVRTEEAGVADLAAVVRRRIEFWSPLAAEQERAVSSEVVDEVLPVHLAEPDIEAVIDALIENVLSHTPDGTPFAITVQRGSGAVLVVEDAGAGFMDGSAVERGTSTRDSTGLGLDIVRRAVEDAGGSLVIGESRNLGGAGIVITLPIDNGM